MSIQINFLLTQLVVEYRIGERVGKSETDVASKQVNIASKFKGILHQENFCRLNLIFWIVMGCGIAHFARRGLKTT